jgi:hypothetical protein
VSAVVAADPAQGFDGGNVITPDASSVLTHSVDLFRPGVDVQKTIVGNPTSVAVGTTIVYHFTITNISDGDLNTVALDDPNGNTPDLIFNSISDPLLGNLTANVIAAGLDVLDFGETGSFDVNYTVQVTDVPSLTNTVVVHYHPDGFSNDVTDRASVTVAVQTGGRVAPTGTTPQQFIDFVVNGTAGDPGDDDGFADGGFNYTAAGGIITNVFDPGAAFFFTIFTAPSNNFNVQVVQDAVGLGPQYEMDVTTLQVLEVVGSSPNATGNVLANIDIPDATDPLVNLNGASLGGIDLTGKLLVLRWRIAPRTIQGEADPGVTYTLNFGTQVNGVPVDQDPDGILVIRSNSLHLADMTAANSTGEQLPPEALQATIDEALASWREAGISAEALNGLRQPNVSIDNLSDNVLGFQFGNESVIDGDAADYGYSTSRIDLPGVEHELGQSLGFDHDVLGESLVFSPVIRLRH